MDIIESGANVDTICLDLAKAFDQVDNAIFEEIVTARNSRQIVELDRVHLVSMITDDFGQCCSV